MSVVASSVRSVTLYQRGAVVTRTATISSSGQAVFDGLPLCLEDDSVQVSVAPEAADAGVRVSNVVLNLEVPQDDEARAPARNEALDKAQRMLEALELEIRDVEASMQRLQKIEIQKRKGAGRGQPPAAIPLEGRLMWIAFSSRELERMETRRAELERQAKEARERESALQEGDRRTSTNRNARKFEARKQVRLDVAGVQGDALISLTYRVPGVRWAPSYVLRLDGERARLQMRAVVAQRTGEDWSGAALTVSTASTQRWFALPELDAIRVGRRQPPPRGAGWREAPPNVDALFADYDRAFDDMPPTDTGVTAVAGMSAGGAADGFASESEDFEEMDAPPLPSPAPVPAAPPQPSLMAARAFEPEEAPAKKMAFGRKRSEGQGAFGGAMSSGPGSNEIPEPEPPPVPLPPQIDRGWSDYTNLRMQAPDQAQRGRLQRKGRLGSRGHDVGAQAVKSARRDAAKLESIAPPPAHRWIDVQKGYDYAYPCDVEVTIPSDGAPHVVAVLETVAQAQRRYVCVPGISEDVFRTAVVRNPLETPLPDGPLDVYLEDTFVLTSKLEGTPSGGRMELGLGVEPAVKVARNVAFSEDSEGLLKKQNAYMHRVSVDVQNLLSREAEVEIRERVPVPARRDDEDIEVEESSVDPSWDTYEPKGDALRGGRRWRVTVAAGEKASLNATWTIRVPGSSELVGGNRRER